MFVHRFSAAVLRTLLRTPRLRFSTILVPPRLLSVSCLRLDQPLVFSLSRNFSKVSDSAEAELYFEDIFELGIEGEDPLFDLRHYFYPDSLDPHIRMLSHAASVAEVLNCVTGLDKPTSQHLTQALATLYHLQKVCNVVGEPEQYSDLRNNVRIYNDHLAQLEKYRSVLQLVQDNIDLIPLREAGFMLMVLRKLGEPLSSPVMQQLYLHLIRNIASCDMEALSYMTVAIRPRYLDPEEMDHANGHVWRLGLVPVVPRLQAFVETCTTTDELRKIVICYNAMALLLTKNMMNRLAIKVTSFLAEGKLDDPSSTSLLSKLLSLVLNKYDWHTEHGDYVCRLLEQYRGKTDQLRPVQLVLLSKVLRNFGQPVDLFEEVYDTLCNHVRRRHVHYVPSIVLLAQVLGHNNLAMPLPEVEERLRVVINSEHLVDNMADVYDILRTVGVVDRSLVQQYFDRCLELLHEEPAEVNRLAVRYNSLYNIYTGFYKNREFEKRVTGLITGAMMDTSVPSSFAAYLSVFLSFNNTISQAVMDRFHAMLPQLNPFSLMNISIGIEHQLMAQQRVGTTMPPHRDKKNDSHQRIDEISVQMNKACLNMLCDTSRDLTIPELSFLFRNFTKRRSMSDETFFHLMTERMKEKMDSGCMSSYIGQHLCLSIDSVRPLMELPELVDRLLNYFTSCPDLHSRMHHRLLVFCYKTDHRPPQILLDMVAKSMLRDMESVVGLRALVGGVALCGFQAMPAELARAIFSGEFMAKLDKEMEMCQDGRNYIRKLREALMLLNRCLVLQYPEYGVPWFHEKYCKEHEPELNRRPNSECYVILRSEVYEELCSLVGGWRYVRENSASQYYNHIDFEVAFDQANNPIDMFATSTPEPARRVAVLVFDKSEYTSDTRRLLGKQAMAARHLQLQGWQVIFVNPFSWSAMCMSEAAARRTYLQQSLLQAAAS